jgi:hypothetical protein
MTYGITVWFAGLTRGIVGGVLLHRIAHSRLLRRLRSMSIVARFCLTTYDFATLTIVFEWYF